MFEQYMTGGIPVPPNFKAFCSMMLQHGIEPSAATVEAASGDTKLDFLEVYAGLKGHAWKPAESSSGFYNGGSGFYDASEGPTPNKRKERRDAYAKAAASGKGTEDFPEKPYPVVPKRHTEATEPPYKKEWIPADLAPAWNWLKKKNRGRPATKPYEVMTDIDEENFLCMSYSFFCSVMSTCDSQQEQIERLLKDNQTMKDQILAIETLLSDDQTVSKRQKTDGEQKSGGEDDGGDEVVRSCNIT